METNIINLTDETTDFWNENDFESAVSATLISCFESKIKKNKGVPPSDRLKDETLKLFRKIGPYIPSNLRYLIDTGGKVGYFDLENDTLPNAGCLSLRIPKNIQDNQPDGYHGYIYNILIKKSKSLGKHWHRRASGQLYVMYILSMTNNGFIEGERRYFTAGKNGVLACESRLQSSSGFSIGKSTETLSTEQSILDGTSRTAAHCLQYLADRKHCWVITAKEKEAVTHLGCMYEEIKSLLYARELPLSETGRKRPILHLVEAHKRRMKNGINIDIKPFLRGLHTVEIAGTEFTVKPPKSIQRPV